MKKYLLVFSIAFLNPLLQNLLAQEDFAIIEKNINIDARGLYHNLNKTKDTLVLKSDTKINYVYSINENQEREIDNYVDSKTYKLSLHNLSKGKHVFVVRQSPVLIVFVIRIFGNSQTLASIDED